MKFYFSILLALTVHVSLHAQISNGSFELWEAVENYEEPVGWATNQDTNYIRIEKDTLSIFGEYSMKLVPADVPSWGNCSSLAVTHAKFDTPLPANSVLTFYVKSVPEYPELDTNISLRITVLAKNSDTLVGGYTWDIPSILEEFTKVEIPLSFDHMDALTIEIYGGAGNNPLDGPCIGRSFSWIDGISLDSGTSVPYSPETESQNILVYPNPSSGRVHIGYQTEKNLHYELYSLIGQLISMGHIDNGELAIHEKGTFLLRLFTCTNNENVYTSKLIVVN